MAVRDPLVYLFGNKSDFHLKIASLGPLLVCFLVEIWSDKSLILRFFGLIFCLAALNMHIVDTHKSYTTTTTTRTKIE